MTAEITIRCETLGCTASITREAHSLTGLRSALRTDGWTSEHWRAAEYPHHRVSDHCPECAPAFFPGGLVFPGHVPYERCALNGVCPSRNPCSLQYHPHAVEVYDWWGHDPMGHRVGRIAVRHGLYPLAYMLGVPLDVWLDCPGFGRTAAYRWQALMSTETYGE